ncbi:MAG: PIN domain-containing protein [Candidatus Lokiarchaeota archaeon]|nr:PIN domain-containing protein [Candidatus Lokiarchaeota archaeon]
MLYLDTTIAIGWMHGDFTVEQILSKVSASERLAITSVSMYEIYAGLFTMQFVKKSKKGQANIDKEADSIRRLERALVQVEFSTRAAQRSAALYFSLIGAGEQIELFDCMIAGTILARGDKDILTQNVDHFTRIEDLNVISLF